MVYKLESIRLINSTEFLEIIKDRNHIHLDVYDNIKNYLNIMGKF